MRFTVDWQSCYHLSSKPLVHASICSWDKMNSCEDCKPVDWNRPSKLSIETRLLRACGGGDKTKLLVEPCWLPTSPAKLYIGLFWLEALRLRELWGLGGHWSFNASCHALLSSLRLSSLSLVSFKSAFLFAVVSSRSSCISSRRWRISLAMAENALFICALRDGIDEAMGMVGRYADWLTTALAISCLLEPKILKAETRSDHLHCEGGWAWIPGS